MIVNGAIRANGGVSAGSVTGDGSGGSILIQTSRLSGDGFITANGGGTLIVLEGGYDLDSIGENFLAFAENFMDHS